MMILRLKSGRRLMAAALCCCLAVPAAMFAAEEGEAAASAPAADAVDAAMDQEIRYVGALIDNGFPDLATPVIDAAKQKWPDAGPRLRALSMQSELRLGRFDKVQKAIDALPSKSGSEYWALKLAMADAYYAQGKMKDCAAIYQDFFAQVKKPGRDLRSFYIEAAYKWAQMLVNDKKPEDAAEVYDGLLSQLTQPSDEQAWCTIASDDTELLLKLAAENPSKRSACLDRANKLVDKLLWKTDYILVFGRAVSMKAHIELLRGKVEKAQGMVESYLPQLRQIHDDLMAQDPDGRKGYLKQSPMPECRYLLAKMLWQEAQEEAKKPKPDDARIKDLLFGEKGKDGKRNGAGAFNHAVNVFVKYPESTWAAAAGDMGEAISKFVKDRYNAEVKTNISPAQRAKVRQMQFRNANETYRNNDFENAIKAYRDVLSQFPETPESVAALGNLADSYLAVAAKTTDAKEKESLLLDAEAVEGYLGERFAGLAPELARAAGDQVLRFAAKEHDLGALARSQRLYDLYFQNYPDHYGAAQLATSLAAGAYKDEDYAKAIRYFTLVATVYTNSTYYLTALGNLAASYGKTGDAAQELVWLRAYAAACTRPAQKAKASLRLAYAEQQAGQNALREAETNTADAAELQKKGLIALVRAAKEFRTLAALSESAQKDPTVSSGDKKDFEQMRENAVYLIGECLQRMPPQGKSDPRAMALKAYDAYLEAYPKGKYAPVVLVKEGTIYTAQKDVPKAQEAFARLAKDFPDSDEAKNSKPRLAKALIDMGLKPEGVAVYSEMLGTDGTYTPGQFLAAGEALLEARAWETAITAFEKTLAKAGTNQVAVVGHALLGKAQALYGAGRLAEAQEALANFVEDPRVNKTRLVVDANYLMIDVASELGRKEKDDNTRAKFFAAAVGALKKVRVYSKEKTVQDELDLMLGDIHRRRMAAEEAMNLKKQAEETRGLAMASYQTFVMSHAPSAEYPANKMTPAELTNLERAYSSLLPLMAAAGKEHSPDVLKYGEDYLALFPDGKHKTDIQNAMNQARAQQ